MEAQFYDVLEASTQAGFPSSVNGRPKGLSVVHDDLWETLFLRGLRPIGIATIFAPRIFRGFSTKSAVDTLSYKTVSVNKENADKKWLLVDAEGQRLGRLCTEIARLLRGKHKVNFTPHADCGDYVIVINAEKVELTGNKWEDKEYIRFSGYPGGQYRRTAKEVRDRTPERLVENAVRGMLPKNRLGRAIYKNLHVVVGADHKHEAQQPTAHAIPS